MSEEEKKLRGSCIHYLLNRGNDFNRITKLNTLELLREVSISYAKSEGIKGFVVSYHFEEDTK